MYVFLADVVAGLHLGYVLAVVLGLGVTLLGGALGWEWVRNRWFRGLHLGMILGVVGRTLVWRECPLTWWERDLRAAGGQENFEGSVVGKILHDAIHPDLPLWIFPIVYAAFALLVVTALWFVPVRWRKSETSPAGVLAPADVPSSGA